MAINVDQENLEAVEAWNTVLFEKFVRFRELVTSALGAHGNAVLERHPPKPGSRVLDVGCGFGDTTQVIARKVGPTGQAVGVDAAERFIAAAREEARAAGVENARFLVTDVQTGNLEGPYDQTFARMGTMFFASPVAAFRNIRRSMKDGGLLSIVVWRRKVDNPFFYDIEQRVLEIIPHPERKADQVTCGPGPFSMSDPHMVSDQLQAAGFDRVGFERFDAPVKIGADLAHALEFATALGPAGEVLRLAGEEGERRRPEVLQALRDVLEPLVRPEGVFGASSTWIVSARAG